MPTAGEVRELIEERPDLEPALHAVLRADEPFVFGDIDIDSGAFGELVSRGFVEDTGSGYLVVDKEAIQRGLADDVPAGSDRTLIGLDRPALPVTRVELAILTAMLAVVVAFRLTGLPNVYHSGYVVLSGNDPYAYRYLVEQLLTHPDVTPSNLGFGVSRGEPLYVVVIWLTTRVLGGTVDAAGHVLAWYPVVSAVLTALLGYATAILVTGDRRIGLATVAMLAVIPGHAFRTGLGFADHHAFDYPWHVLALLCIVLIAREAHREESPGKLPTIVGALGIAVGVAGQTLAWDNSPLLLLPIGAVLALEGLRAVRAGDSPWWTIGPVLAGVGVGAGVTWWAHESLGWHTTLVASAPLLLFVGGIGVLAGASVVHRLGGDYRVLAGLEAVGLVTGALVVRDLRPDFWTRLIDSVRVNLLGREGIGEVVGLFGDSLTWLVLLGFALFVALPYLAWGAHRAIEDGRWLPPVIYASYFLVLSLIQVRFVGHLAPVLALFAGFGLLHLAAWVDLARPPAPFADGSDPALRLPDRRTAATIGMLYLLISSMGIIMTPVVTSQITIPQDQSDAALWMADYSEEHGMEWPGNYVFSEWSWSRMYNYFANGESRSYGYAQSNYQSFVSSTEPAEWYDRLGNRRGFVVTTPDVVGLANQTGTRLHRSDGSRAGGAAGLAHYRLVHVSGEYKVFRVVPGAVLEGTAAPNATVTATTNVDLESYSFEYARRTTVDRTGNFTVRVAHPGTYRVANETVTVPGPAVINDTAVELPA